VGNTTANPTPVAGKGAGGGTFSSLTTAQWATALLLSLQKAGYKAPVTANNIANIQRLIAHESSGNTAGFLRDNNPFNLNTGATPHGNLYGNTGKIVQEWGIYVQTFNSVQDGLNATVSQLQHNPALLAIINENGSPALFGGGLSTSAWASGSYANSTEFPKTIPFTGSSPLPLPVNPTGIFGQIGEPILTGTVVGLNATGEKNFANTVIGGVTSTSAFLAKITNPTNLKNVGIFVAGLGLAVTGLLIFFAQTKEAKSVESVAAKAA
jgi:hypothetical protein